MNEQNYEIEDGFIFCERCGLEYTDNLSECPFCRAEKQAKIITKQGSYHSRMATAAGLLMVLVLVAGAILIVRSSFEYGGWNIGREYAIETEETQTQSVGAGTTQQQTDIDSSEREEQTDTEEESETEESSSETEF